MTKVPLDEWSPKVIELCQGPLSTVEVISCEGSDTMQENCWVQCFINTGLPLILDRLEAGEEIKYTWIYQGDLDSLTRNYGDLIRQRKDQIKRSMEKERLEIYLRKPVDEEFVLIDAPKSLIVYNETPPTVSVLTGTFFKGEEFKERFRELGGVRLEPLGLEHMFTRYANLAES